MFNRLKNRLTDTRRHGTYAGRTVAALLSACCVLVTGCSQSAASVQNLQKIQDGMAGVNVLHPAGSAEAMEANAGGLSAWVAYWDTETVLAELAQLESLQTLYYFEAYFDSKDQLFLPTELTELMASIDQAYPEPSWNKYLTIVNDWTRTDGTISQKDTDLLYRTLQDEASRQAQIDTILRLALENGFDGIEIDYENLRDDRKLWGLFLPFCEELYRKAVGVGLGVRVTLESATPFEALAFPKGPVYAVMCYNLFGSHSGPGPKADQAYLQQVLKKSASLPGKREFALATGGFDWSAEGVQSLTEAQAVALQQQYQQVPKRDQDSNCQTFSYTDNAGVAHTVWYADGDTLRFWKDVLAQGGSFGTSIWRLGGNVTLEHVLD